jgi:hypothetical protein
MASNNDLLNALPRRLRLRLESVGSFVTALLKEREAGLSQRSKLTRDQLQQIQLVVFIYVLDHLLQEGTNAAIGAVDTFKALGLQGFAVGSAHFADRNENVLLGQRLSQALRSAVVDQDLLDVIDEAQSIRSLTFAAYSEVRRG